jgi:Divergent InlB B-repeat domain
VALALLAVAPWLPEASSPAAVPWLHVHELRADGSRPVVRTPAAARATWCGTATGADRTPNVVAGNPVHWIYAIPFDASDRFPTVASLMQTDAEAIDAWWRREDPLRAPRNDLTPLSCGTQLDLTSLRFGQGSGQFESDFGFGQIMDSLEDSGFDSRATKYVVYYDGAVAEGEEDVCGRGGTLQGGIGLAVVYLQGCNGVSTATVAAHELLHTFGAVPDEAPNGCEGHVCDDSRDLMYASLGDEPFEQKLLDIGRDDYYGHAALFDDSQDARWLVHLDRQVPLRVNVTGPGRVSSDLPGLDCARNCTTTWNADTQLRLTASPGTKAKLVRWSGACSGAGACRLTVGPGATANALFAPRVLKLSVLVRGRGSVRSSRGGITCRPRCTATLQSFVPVRLTATPAKGWKLRAWTGACRGSKRSCTLPMDRRATARAVFVRR